MKAGLALAQRFGLFAPKEDEMSPEDERYTVRLQRMLRPIEAAMEPKAALFKR
jgi:hypothetical protein